MTRPTLRFLLARLWQKLAPRRRRHFKWLLFLMLLSGFAEVISLGAVLPFIGVLAVPEKVLAQPVVAAVAQAWGVTSADQLVLPLTLMFVAAAMIAGAIRILVTWLSARLTFATGADISIEVYRRALYQPYHVHVGRSSSEMISGITGKVGHTTLGVLLPFLQLISSSVLMAAIVFALIAIDPAVALIAAAGFGASYGLITGLLRRRLRRNSQRIADEHTLVVKALQEGLGGIRDVLLSGTQPVYCETYRQADLRWRMAQGENVFIAQSPRFAMEALGMVLIAFLAFGLSRQPGGIVDALPVLGALALGAQRLLPAMQQAYRAWASIAGSHASFVDTIELIDQPMPSDSREALPPPMPFHEHIRFESVRFRYSNDGPWILSDFSLTIPKGARLGFVGTTGSGKSTVMDLLMGLLEPTSGHITVDNQVIQGGLVRPWQQTIAHVPQSIFLADSTLAENIAFGIKRDSIDLDRVRLAAHGARIAEFIESGPRGYDAVVGERGVRLSGGQRQRIGIARALYRKASVLVLDEATSALDNETERSVMEAIEALHGDLTILIIAHRLSTVKNCDSIVEIERGTIVAEGNYDRLMKISQGFKGMTQVSSTV